MPGSKYIYQNQVKITENKSKWTIFFKEIYYRIGLSKWNAMHFKFLHRAKRHIPDYNQITGKEKWLHRNYETTRREKKEMGQCKENEYQA